MRKIVQLEIPFDYEEFKDIEGFEGLYQVTNQGRVYSLISNKFLKFGSGTGNYLFVKLSKDGKVKNYRIHRLVANAFIPNPHNLPQVNHISEIKTDNRVDNLEWCTASYNNNYGSHIARILQHPNYKASRKNSGKPKKAVLQFTLNGEFVAEFPSTREAERATRIFQTNISKCCLGKLHSAGKYLWRFKDVS